jgi:hypothetical protein
MDPGLGLRPTRDDKRGLARKLAGPRAALLNPMPFVRRPARRLHANAIILKPTVPRTIPKTSDRDYWEERVAAAEEARFALSEF